MNEDLSKYKESFINEAQEHLEMMNLSLVGLEKNPEDPVPLGEIFRAAHTLKSMAATMDYPQTSALCHAMEDILARVKDKTMEVKVCSDILFESFDLLELNLKGISERGVEQDTGALVHRLQSFLSTHLENQGNREVTGQEVESPPLPEKIQRINVKVTRLDTLMNLAEELLVAKMRLDQVREGLENPELNAATETLGRLISEIQYNVMQIRMVPIGFVFNRFPRMVRDLAKQEGKEISLVLAGDAIELDRGIADEIGESLIHLLRNAVDHGLETALIRKQSGKPPQGTITITATRTKESAVILVADDGVGLNREKILQKDKQGDIQKILFSGLSTASEVTDISGRGIGLQVVKKKIEAIGGRVSVESSPNQGTTFRLEIPLTLAIIKTLFVTVREKLYAIPMTSIDRLVTVKKEDLKGMFDYEAIVLDGEEVPLTRLDILFGYGHDRPFTKQPVVVIRRGEDRLGLAVDSLVATQEVVIKPLSRIIRENKWFSGSALIGSGEVVLILDVAHLVLSKKETRHLQKPLEISPEIENREVP